MGQILLVAALLLLPLTGHVQSLLPDNEMLQALYDADQADRGPTAPLLEGRAKRDEDRRAQVKSLLAQGQVRTAKDYYNAAMVFQHGANAEEIRLAHGLAIIASSLDPSWRRGRWMIAASWDRLMMHLDRPQWYGTQLVSVNGEWVLYKIDETLASDQDREALGVVSLEQSKANAKKMTEDLKNVLEEQRKKSN